jgi:hypothetical protein
MAFHGIQDSGPKWLVKGLENAYFLGYMAKGGYQTKRGLKEICSPFIKGLED